MSVDRMLTDSSNNRQESEYTTTTLDYSMTRNSMFTQLYMEMITLGNYKMMVKWIQHPFITDFTAMQKNDT